MRQEDFDQCYKLANDLYTKEKAKGKMPVMLQLKGFKGHTELADPRWQELPPHVWHHYKVYQQQCMILQQVNLACLRLNIV